MEQAGIMAAKIAKMRRAAEQRTEAMRLEPTGTTCQPAGMTSKYDQLEKHGIYRRFWNTSAGNIDRRGVPSDVRTQWQRVKAFIATLDAHIHRGEGLILAGGVGTMKTTMAIAVLRELVDQKGQGYFIPMASLLDTINGMRERHDASLQAFEQKLRTTSLLVLDDLGAEYDHTWVQCKVDAIVNERYNRMRSTIVTTNLSAQDIRDRYQLRIYDRLRATNQLITFTGKSSQSLRKTADF